MTESDARLWPDPDTGPWHVHFGWALVDGRRECVDIRIHSQRLSGKVEQLYPLPPGAQPAPLTSSLLHSLPLGTLIEEERAAQAAYLRAEFQGRWQPATDAGRQAVADEVDQWTQWRPGRPGRPPVRNQAFYERIARQYSDALRAHLDPTKEVAEVNHVARSTAGKWVWRARQRGLLPPTTRGVKKGRSR